MSRRFAAWMLALVLVGASAHAADMGYTPFVGKWQGTVTNNLKDAKGGGNATQGETGTPVSIVFESKDGKALTGSSTVGKNPAEMWTLQGDTYTWTDGEITVTTKRISMQEIPSWVSTTAKLQGMAEGVYAFKYNSCTVNKDKSPCVMGTHLPNGIDKSGIWLFTVKPNEMTSDVFYTYDTGGKRILQQSLKRQMMTK